MQVSLPDDVFRLVVAFVVDVERARLRRRHRLELAETLRRIPRAGVDHTVRFLHDKFVRLPFDRIVSLDTVAGECVDDEAHIVGVLSRCTCCARHQRRRPATVYDAPPALSAIPIPGDFKLLPRDVDARCACRCHATTRVLCRSFAARRRRGGGA